MLPGFRFLFAAIVLSMSILVFGLGAAALLRAAHEEFASTPSWRAAPETDFAQAERSRRRPVLAMLRVDAAGRGAQKRRTRSQPTAAAGGSNPRSCRRRLSPKRPSTPHPNPRRPRRCSARSSPPLEAAKPKLAAAGNCTGLRPAADIAGRRKVRPGRGRQPAQAVAAVAVRRSEAGNDRSRHRTTRHRSKPSSPPATRSCPGRARTERARQLRRDADDRLDQDRHAGRPARHDRNAAAGESATVAKPDKERHSRSACGAQRARRARHRRDSARGCAQQAAAAAASRPVRSADGTPARTPLEFEDALRPGRSRPAVRRADPIRPTSRHRARCRARRADTAPASAPARRRRSRSSSRSASSCRRRRP